MDNALIQFTLPFQMLCKQSSSLASKTVRVKYELTKFGRQCTKCTTAQYSVTERAELDQNVFTTLSVKKRYHPLFVLLLGERRDISSYTHCYSVLSHCTANSFCHLLLLSNWCCHLATALAYG